jgi:SSS family solute:Na+ symporter
VTGIDYFVLLFYVFGVFAVGVGLSLKVQKTDDLFKAGGRSPWWASGLSGFMTMFSAGTFVVWGGIAYRLGLVAVMINLCYGLAALLVGYFVAGRWKQLGIHTPAQFIQQRYGTAALHLYTWVMMVYRMVGTAVALYSLAVLLVNLMPLAEGNPFRDPATGNLSLTWAVLLFGGCVVIYTMVGGLWAVLMTDVLQFLVLNLAVIFMVPLILSDVGGIGGFVRRSPEGFLMPVAGPYTWFFLAGWCTVHFFMVGAEWAFVQRFICVPSAKDARKSAYLFGTLYLISPVLWLLPPLAYRLIHPIPAGASEAEVTALAESAYIMACRHVLPVGMVGLMLAAMFSATASMVSSQLNVFAGVLTEDVYARLLRQRGDRHLLWAGRGFSLLLGSLLIALALLIRWLGGAEKVIIAITALIVTPLLAPTIWGLFHRGVTQAAVWITVAVCFTAGAAATLVWPDALTGWGKVPEILIGVGLPVLLMGIIGMLQRGRSAGWRRVEALAARAENEERQQPLVADRAPAYIVASALAACGTLMAALIPINQTDRGLIAAFAVLLFLLAAGIAALAVRQLPSRTTRTLDTQE